MLKIAALLAIAMTPSLASADPIIPDEADKIWALKRAYELNGNSMVRAGSIDLSDEYLKRILVPPPAAPPPTPKKKHKP